MSRYAELLRRHRVRDAQVVAKYPPRQILRFTARSLWLLLIRLPLGLVGLVIHFLPYQAVALAAKWLTKTEDRAATNKVLASMVFYPLTWILLAAAAGAFSSSAALLALVLGPLTGGVALRLYLRSALFWDRVRGFLLLRSSKPQVVELRKRRRQAAEAIEGLVELYTPD